MLPALLFLAGFFLVPLLDNTARSFDPRIGLGNYVKLLTDPYYLNVIGVTVAVSTLVTVICLALGYPTAYFLVRLAGRWAGLIVFLLIAPLLTSIIMRSFGWQVILARGGLLNNMLLGLGWIDRPLRLLNGPAAGVIGLVHVQLPFMVLSIAAVLQGINPRLEEAAQILGAGRWSAFFRVTLPLSLDGIGTGCILVFMLTNGSFVTLLLLGGGSLQTLPLLIYQQFNTTRDTGMAAAMSNVLLVIAVACLALQLRLLRRRGVRT
jgi:putative spermidine/putrescine transport system permease protein